MNDLREIATRIVVAQAGMQPEPKQEQEGYMLAPGETCVADDPWKEDVRWAVKVATLVVELTGDGERGDIVRINRTKGSTDAR